MRTSATSRCCASVTCASVQDAWPQDDRRLRQSTSTSAEGEVVGVVGETGCGKTVTGLSVLGLLPETAACRGGGDATAGPDLLTYSEDDFRRIRGTDVCHGLPEPGQQLQPGVHHRLADARACSRSTRASRDRPPTRASARCMPRVPCLIPSASRSLPAPAHRAACCSAPCWDVPAGSAQAAHRRRADHGARRDHRGTDPRAHPGPAAGDGLQRPLHHPRPGRGAPGLSAGWRCSTRAASWRPRTRRACSRRRSTPTREASSQPFRARTAAPATLTTIPGSVPPDPGAIEGCVFRDRCHLAIERCATELPAAATDLAAGSRSPAT